jgi:8-oxo-dGTP pyrophosphatase MutT (NUDIX family)
MTLGARTVVENQAGQVLLVRHTYTKGLYFPGGGVEHGELIFDAMRREIEEEGGVRLTGPARLVGIYSNHRFMRNDHVALYQIAAADWEPFGDPIGLEISECVWCDPLAPPEDATAGTKRRLAELYRGGTVSLHW